MYISGHYFDILSPYMTLFQPFTAVNWMKNRQINQNILQHQIRLIWNHSDLEGKTVLSQSGLLSNKNAQSWSKARKKQIIFVFVWECKYAHTSFCFCGNVPELINIVSSHREVIGDGKIELQYILQLLENFK